MAYLPSPDRKELFARIKRILNTLKEVVYAENINFKWLITQDVLLEMKFETYWPHNF